MRRSVLFNRLMNWIYIIKIILAVDQSNPIQSIQSNNFIRFTLQYLLRHPFYPHPVWRVLPSNGFPYHLELRKNPHTFLKFCQKKQTVESHRARSISGPKNCPQIYLWRLGCRLEKQLLKTWKLEKIGWNLIRNRPITSGRQRKEIQDTTYWVIPHYTYTLPLECAASKRLRASS